jgi:hypothetical protein
MPVAPITNAVDAAATATRLVLIRMISPLDEPHRPAAGRRAALATVPACRDSLQTVFAIILCKLALQSTSAVILAP